MIICRIRGERDTAKYQLSASAGKVIAQLIQTSKKLKKLRHEFLLFFFTEEI